MRILLGKKAILKITISIQNLTKIKHAVSVSDKEKFSGKDKFLCNLCPFLQLHICLPNVILVLPVPRYLETSLCLKSQSFHMKISQVMILSIILKLHFTLILTWYPTILSLLYLIGFLY